MKIPPVTTKDAPGAGAESDATVTAGAFATIPLHHTMEPPEYVIATNVVDVPGGRDVLPEPDDMPVPMVIDPALRLISVQANPDPIFAKFAVSVIG